MKAMNATKKHGLYKPIFLISFLFLISFFSCKKDEFSQPVRIMEPADIHAMQPKELSASSVSYLPAKIFTIVSKDTVDRKISLENNNFSYYENFILTVQNGTASNTKVQKVEILIDGITVITNSDFRRNTSFISKALSGLTQSSVMEVRLDGSRNRFITISIDCELKPGVISDIDGNYYNTVKIGNQEWMAGNLKTTRYRSGDVIGTTDPPTLQLNIETLPEFQWAYEGNETYVSTYGRLYTWYAVTDIRNLCPAGWHVPSSEEWYTLKLYLHDQNGDDADLNDYGFELVHSGFRSWDGTFNNLGESQNFWTSSPMGTNSAYFFYDDKVMNYMYKPNGLSVRCMKD